MSLKKFIINVLDSIIELFLWFVIIVFTLGGGIVGYEQGGNVITSLIVGFIIGILLLVFGTGPLMLFLEMRNYLKAIDKKLEKIINKENFDINTNIDTVSEKEEKN